MIVSMFALAVAALLPLARALTAELDSRAVECAARVPARVTLAGTHTAAELEKALAVHWLYNSYYHRVARGVAGFDPAIKPERQEHKYDNGYGGEARFVVERVEPVADGDMTRVHGFVQAPEADSWLDDDDDVDRTLQLYVTHGDDYGGPVVDFTCTKALQRENQADNAAADRAAYQEKLRQECAEKMPRIWEPLRAKTDESGLFDGRVANQVDPDNKFFKAGSGCEADDKVDSCRCLTKGARLLAYYKPVISKCLSDEQKQQFASMELRLQELAIERECAAIPCADAGFCATAEMCSGGSFTARRTPEDMQVCRTARAVCCIPQCSIPTHGGAAAPGRTFHFQDLGFANDERFWEMTVDGGDFGQCVPLFNTNAHFDFFQITTRSQRVEDFKKDRKKYDISHCCVRPVCAPTGSDESGVCMPSCVGGERKGGPDTCDIEGTQCCVGSDAFPYTRETDNNVNQEDVDKVAAFRDGEKGKLQSSAAATVSSLSAIAMCAIASLQ